MLAGLAPAQGIERDGFAAAMATVPADAHIAALAAIFAVFTVTSGAQRLGCVAAITLYLPLLLCRVVPRLADAQRFRFMWGSTAVEAILLLDAVALLLLPPLVREVAA